MHVGRRRDKLASCVHAIYGASSLLVCMSSPCEGNHDMHARSSWGAAAC